MSVLEVFARLYPWSVEPSDELCRCLEFIDYRAEPESVVRAGYGVGLLGIALALVAWVRGMGYPVVLVTGALAVLAVHVIHEWPVVLATARRTRALGNAPDLVARTVLRMRLAPSPERAAAFAAREGEGTLAASLADHVEQSKVTGETALEQFGREWTEWYPALGRSLGLVVASAAMDGPDRERTLDRALSVVIDGTRSQMRSFASKIHRPATALYAFGVVLPTALVALLPAAHAAGVGVTTATVVVVYDVLLPVGIVAAAVWLVAHRPVAFPPPNVGRDHPDVPDSSLPAALAGAGAGIAGWLLAGAVLPAWGGPVASVGLGAGVWLWLAFRPVVAVYDLIYEVEAELTDALALVGRRVARGVAVESAISEAAGELDGAMGDVLDSAAARQRQLQVGVREAFLGDDGALSDLPSPRARGTLGILGVAASEGRPAGSAIITLADHVDDLHRVERESRHDLEQVCGTLQTTGAVFGPMVAGATVALADSLAGSGLPGGGQSLPWLGLVVGGYVLASAVVLPTLATSLARGFDGPLAGHRVGRALVAGTVVYLVSYQFVAGVA
jgi:hypothetical protein